eukprot:1342768-Amorphochlora_amoeboformis.AAC.1
MEEKVDKREKGEKGTEMDGRMVKDRELRRETEDKERERDQRTKREAREIERMEEGRENRETF